MNDNTEDILVMDFAHEVLELADYGYTVDEMAQLMDMDKEIFLDECHENHIHFEELVCWVANMCLNRGFSFRDILEDCKGNEAILENTFSIAFIDNPGDIDPEMWFDE